MQHDRRGRFVEGARAPAVGADLDAIESSDAVLAGNRLEALDQLAEAHRHAIDADCGAALELDLDVRGSRRGLRQRFSGLEQRIVDLRGAVVATAADGPAPEIVVDSVVGRYISREADFLGAGNLGQRGIKRGNRLRETAAVAAGGAVRNECGLLDGSNLDQ